MTVTYTLDLFATLDGFGSYAPPGDWGGYWGKQGPELLARREALYAEPQRMLFGATTYREFATMLGSSDVETGVFDSWVGAMTALPTTVVSRTLTGTLDWPGTGVVTAAADDAVEVVRELKAVSPVPIRSHGSLSLNRALLAAGLVDRLQVTVFPVIAGRTGDQPLFVDAGDYDLELLEARTLDGRTQELIYAPTQRRW